MTQVIQATCPKCKKVLRIPADWVARSMRCKHCKTVFQSKGRPVAEKKPVSAPPTVPADKAPVLMAPAANVVVANEAPVTEAPMTEEGGFGDFGQGPLVSVPGRQKKPSARGSKSSPWKKGLIITVMLLLVVGTVGALAGQSLLNLFRGDPSIIKVAQGNENSPGEEFSKGTKGKKGEGPSKKEGPDKNTVSIPVPRGSFPRRALLINVNDYLLLNPLAYGSPTDKGYPGSSTGSLAHQFTRPPLNMLEHQITELSDGIPDDIANRTGRKPKAPLKDVIENTLNDFLKTSRAQDRIIVLFAGHVVDGEKECYLIPIEGNKDDVKTLIPLAWVLDKLAKCQARQKLLILDVCRFPPAAGLERPASGEMSELLDTILQQPPEGVQVWSSCIKGQQSIELEKGSVFLQSLCGALMKGVKGIQEPTNSLPLEQLVPEVNQRLKEILGPQKVDQLSRLTGKDVDNGIAYNPDEPFPGRLEIKPASVEGGAAGNAQVKAILEELNKLPPARSKTSPIKTTHLPPFASKVVEEYQPDYKDWKEMKETADREPEKYALRKAVFDAVKVMEDSHKLVLEEKLEGAGGAIDGKVKSAFLLKQRDPGIMIFEMESALAKLKAAAEERDKEASKRWQANFDFTLARMQSRMVYIYEYNYLLGQIRADNLPALEPIHNGWRFGSRPKVQCPEPKVKDMVKSINRTWKKIAEEHQGTPWAVLATRENLTALGMEWRPTRD
jgi:hypothetical protein